MIFLKQVLLALSGVREPAPDGRLFFCSLTDRKGRSYPPQPLFWMYCTVPWFSPCRGRTCATS